MNASNATSPKSSGATGRDTITFCTSWSRLGQRALQRRQQRAGHEHRLRARVLEHVGVVVRREQRVDRHRDDARVERAEKGLRPVVGVLHEQQHALLAADAQRAQPRRDAARAVGERAVGQRAEVVDERGLGGPIRVRGEQVLREVEGVRRRLHASGRLPYIGLMRISSGGCASLSSWCSGAAVSPRVRREPPRSPALRRAGDRSRAPAGRPVPRRRRRGRGRRAATAA